MIDSHDKVVLAAQEMLDGILDAVSSGEQSFDDITQVLCIVFHQLKETYTDPDSLFMLLQEAETYTAFYHAKTIGESA